MLAQGAVLGCLLHPPPAPPHTHRQAAPGRPQPHWEGEEVGAQALPSGCVASDQRVRLTALGCEGAGVRRRVTSEAPAWLG